MYSNGVGQLGAVGISISQARENGVHTFWVTISFLSLNHCSADENIIILVTVLEPYLIYIYTYFSSSYKLSLYCRYTDTAPHIEVSFLILLSECFLSVYRYYCCLFSFYKGGNLVIE